MDHQPQSPEPSPTPSTDVNSPEADRRPWTVQFVPPPGEGMPSDRLKARAELVRSAGGCGACTCY
jgi:hypothetical protein